MERLGVLEVLRRTEQYFRKAGIESARLDAEVLLAHVLGVKRIHLYAGFDRPLTPGELEACRVLVRRRAGREPVAYLVGSKEFHSLAFAVSPAVLIPRPETEHLVDAAVELTRSLVEPRLLDIGTGSGAIAVSWATECHGGRFVATDVSPEALGVARENAARHGVEERGEFLEGDLYAPVRGHEPFEVVACNPPYVDPAEPTDPECAHEPRRAVFTDGDPLEVYRRLLEGAADLLASGGWLLLELPGSREREIAGLPAPGLALEEVRRDYHGLPRVLLARRSG